MLLDEQKSRILLSAQVGIEFEFYSNFDADETAVKLSRLFNKKIYIETEIHSDFTPTKDIFKLEPAHFIEFDLFSRKLVKKKYWHLDVNENSIKLGEAKEELKYIIEKFFPSR